MWGPRTPFPAPIRRYVHCAVGHSRLSGIKMSKRMTDDRRRDQRRQGRIAGYLARWIPTQPGGHDRPHRVAIPPRQVEAVQARRLPWDDERARGAMPFEG